MCACCMCLQKKTQKFKKAVGVFRTFSTTSMGYRQGCYRINILSNMLKALIEKNASTCIQESSCINSFYIKEGKNKKQYAIFKQLLSMLIDCAPVNSCHHVNYVVNSVTLEINSSLCNQ